MSLDEDLHSRPSCFDQLVTLNCKIAVPDGAERSAQSGFVAPVESSTSYSTVVSSLVGIRVSGKLS